MDDDGDTQDTWCWRWVGGGHAAVRARDRQDAWLRAVALGAQLTIRGALLVPDLPTLQPHHTHR